MQTRQRAIVTDRIQQGNFGYSSEHFLALFDQGPRVEKARDATAAKSDSLFGPPPSKH